MDAIDLFSNNTKFLVSCTNYVSWNYIRNSEFISDVLVVTFEGFEADASTVFGGRVFERLNIDQVAFSAASGSRYQTLTVDGFLKALADCDISRRKKVLLYGYSSGAFAAIYFAQYLNCNYVVLSISPNNPLHPVMKDYLPNKSNPLDFSYTFSHLLPIKNTWIMLDKLCVEDRFFESFLSANYSSGVTVFHVKNADHGTLEALVEVRVISKILKIIIDDGVDEFSVLRVRGLLNEAARVRKTLGFESLIFSISNNLFFHRRYSLLQHFLSINLSKFEGFVRKIFFYDRYASTLFQLGRLDDALCIQEKLFNDFPEDLSVRSFYVELLTESGIFERALQVVNEVICECREHYILYHRRSVIYLKMGMLDSSYEDALLAESLSNYAGWLSDFKKQIKQD